MKACLRLPQLLLQIGSSLHLLRSLPETTGIGSQAPLPQHTRGKHTHPYIHTLFLLKLSLTVCTVSSKHQRKTLLLRCFRVTAKVVKKGFQKHLHGFIPTQYRREGLHGQAHTGGDLTRMKALMLAGANTAALVLLGRR